VHRHPVRGVARGEGVAERQPQVPGDPDVGVVERAERRRVVLHQVAHGERQQLGGVLPRALPPRVEVAAAHHVGGDARVVEVVERRVVHHDVAAAGPLLELLDVLEQAPVGGEEGVVGVPVALDQGVAQEQVARGHRVDAAVVHLARHGERDAVQRDLLEGHHGGLLLLPVRLAVGALDQVRGEGLRPLRLHARHHARPHAVGLHQLGGHDVARRLLRQRRARHDREPCAARTGVVALVGVAQADVRQHPGQQRAVHGVGVQRGGRGPRACRGRAPPGAAGCARPATRGCAGS
jgi:hypothetical protein